MVDERALTDALPRTLSKTDLHGLGALVEGKVRDSYVKGDRRTIVATDRLSAFDRVVTTLPFKGQCLNQLAAWWFREVSGFAANHLISTPDPNVSVVQECEPLAVEIVIRAYVTGVTSTSIWFAYEKGERVFCGHRLPDGLRKNQRLSEPIITPSTKAPKGQHDKSVSRAELLASGAVREEDFDAAARACMKVFEHGAHHLASRGLILVDTKYEVGRRADGTIVIIDEVHTPDSSRIWWEEGYPAAFDGGREPEGLDKEYVRRWLKEAHYAGEGPPPTVPDAVRVEAARRYLEAYEVITGRPFEPDLADPLPRIRRNLGVGS
ncbi:MAG: phosphoribosylaminoimidazolesuccinocarboxamide synthase [Deltaproteobacteria bacterium]|nr:phosphoribosylaminoimidazolesuccinocarboxamide synthase [Deltaproteobacteria bacterium]